MYLERFVAHPFPRTPLCPDFGFLHIGVYLLGGVLELFHIFNLTFVNRVSAGVVYAVEHRLESIERGFPPCNVPVGVTGVQAPCVEAYLVFCALAQRYGHARAVGAGQGLGAYYWAVAYLLEPLHHYAHVCAVRLLHSVVVEVVHVHFGFGGVAFVFVFAAGRSVARIPYNGGGDSLCAALLTRPACHEAYCLHNLRRVFVFNCGLVPEVPQYNTLIVAEAAYHLPYGGFELQRVLG